MQRKTFFASDFHLGVDARLSSAQRERQVVRWLEQCAPEAEAIYLVGDIFEFWFEYKTVVPKGFVRLLGALARLRDAGVPLYAFTGNHDLWMFGYFEQELGIPVYRQPIQRTLHGKQFFIGHGDGLGPNDYGYKRLKRVFSHPFNQWLFGWLHPDVGGRLAHYSSARSRAATPPEEQQWLGEDKEWLYQYAQRKLAQGLQVDYFVFGHRHLAIDWRLFPSKARYLNLGEWLWNPSYGVFDGTDMEIRFFEGTDGKVFGRE